MNDATSGPWRPAYSEAVQRALAKWPNVPACHGWLSLDRRGRWRIAGGIISHPGTVAFLNAHYAADDAGRWFVQNGPQTAYVDLELAPWILSVDPDGVLRTQAGDSLEVTGDLFVTEHGDLLLTTARGLAAVSDRDLAAVAALYATDDGADVLDLLAGLAPGASIGLRDRAGRACRAHGVREDALFADQHVERRPRP